MKCECRGASAALFHSLPGGSGCADFHGILHGQRPLCRICVPAGCHHCVGPSGRGLQPASNIPAGRSLYMLLNHLEKEYNLRSAHPDAPAFGEDQRSQLLLTGTCSGDRDCFDQFPGECWGHVGPYNHRYAPKTEAPVAALPHTDKSNPDSLVKTAGPLWWV